MEYRHVEELIKIYNVDFNKLYRMNKKPNIKQENEVEDF